MGEKTNIEWCDSSVNPTTGCDGCKLWNGRDVRACGDMGDFCSRAVPDDYIVDEIIGAIRSPAGARHFWMLLTKQIRRLAELSVKIGGLPDNCMAMTTVTSQRTAEARIPALLEVECRRRGISIEPLLEPVDLTERGRGLYCESCLDRSTHWCVDPVCDWVIVGGESGLDARLTSPDWIRVVVEQCADANVPCFVKQLGTEWARQAKASDKKGGDPTEWPPDLRVRQVPRNSILSLQRSR